MDIERWKRLAKDRLISGEMSEIEWYVILEALLHASEGDGLCEFDESIELMDADPRWAE